MTRYWTCACGERWPRLKQRCACGRKRPKARVPRHAVTLRDDGYPVYVQVAAAIHGVTDESCCVCGRPKPDSRKHDRDHDHRTGLPRGLACVRCNRELLRQCTLDEARLVVAYLERVESHYSGVAA